MLGTWRNINFYLVPGEWTRSRMDGWIDDEDMRSSVFSYSIHGIVYLDVLLFNGLCPSGILPATKKNQNKQPEVSSAAH